MTWLSFFLLPLSLVYCLISSIRRGLYQHGILAKKNTGALVIIIGNISVGGTGKTPLVIWLVKLLQKNKYKPGVVTRGYGRKKSKELLMIQEHNTASEVGDEPVIIYQNCKCPVVVDSDRVRGATKLVTGYLCNVIISDDGLQHYKLERDIEIGVIDGTRGHGNGLCLPAGPLREPSSRLHAVDAVIINNSSKSFGYETEYKMHLKESGLINVFDRKKIKQADYLSGKTVHALAGIGNPEQFFKQLNMLGMKVIKHPFPDHYNYLTDDILFSKHPIIMTEKDAVKLWNNKDLIIPDKDQYWYLPVSVNIEQQFESFILNKIKEKAYG